MTLGTTDAQIVEVLRITMLGLGVESSITSSYWFYVLTRSEKTRHDAVRFWVLGTVFFQLGIAVLSAIRLFIEACCLSYDYHTIIVSDSLIVTGQILAIIAGCHFFIWNRWQEIAAGLGLRLLLVLLVAKFVV